MELELVAVDPCEVEQVVNEAREVPHLSLDGLARAFGNGRWPT